MSISGPNLIQAINKEPNKNRPSTGKFQNDRSSQSVDKKVENYEIKQGLRNDEPYFQSESNIPNFIQNNMSLKKNEERPAIANTIYNNRLKSAQIHRKNRKHAQSQAQLAKNNQMSTDIQSKKRVNFEHLEENKYNSNNKIGPMRKNSATLMDNIYTMSPKDGIDTM